MESVCALTRTVGSNPTLSVELSLYCLAFLCAVIKFIMRRSIFFLVLLLFSKSVFGSEPLVLVSIAPYQSLVETIVEDTCQVQTIVSGNKDPHTYEVSPKHFKKLHEASIWFRIDEGFENICAKSLTCSQIHLNHNIDIIHGHPTHKGSCASSHIHSYDIHTWLSPKNLQIQTRTIVSALKQQFPEHAALYEKNGDILIEKLKQLDLTVKLITSSTKQRHILTDHGAFAYFCRDYNFVQHTIEKSHGGHLSPKDLLHITEDINNYEIRSIILLKYAGKRSSALLAQRFHMTPVYIDPYAIDVIDNIKTIANTFANL